MERPATSVLSGRYIALGKLKFYNHGKFSDSIKSVATSTQGRVEPVEKVRSDLFLLKFTVERNLKFNPV